MLNSTTHLTADDLNSSIHHHHHLQNHQTSFPLTHLVEDLVQVEDHLVTFFTVHHPPPSLRSRTSNNSSGRGYINQSVTVFRNDDCPDAHFTSLGLQFKLLHERPDVLQMIRNFHNSGSSSGAHFHRQKVDASSIEKLDMIEKLNADELLNVLFYLPLDNLCNLLLVSKSWCARLRYSRFWHAYTVSNLDKLCIETYPLYAEVLQRSNKDTHFAFYLSFKSVLHELCNHRLQRSLKEHLKSNNIDTSHMIFTLNSPSFLKGRTGVMVLVHPHGTHYDLSIPDDIKSRRRVDHLYLDRTQNEHFSSIMEYHQLVNTRLLHYLIQLQD